ncbi:Type II secretion system protein [Sulfitobacter noctilucicola]|uniref:Tight adherence protein B n=1 Tax=Sulfitobacter noctilucicola TaxID=1342301 RepID=A0A7W6Q277_9RHOB|nr:type II secretion system F family protein [Sulfitobacter noctilucicola]KIN62662.1 Type II secretion system protein [Sulfitobacter noctilucicola]MBB4172805.1 tight adherence protein B [Sulfitobacter noctilucicola]
MSLSVALFLVGLFVFVGLVLALLVLADRKRRRHQDRLRRVRTQSVETPVKAREKSAKAKDDKHSFSIAIERELAQTNLRTSVAELLVQVSLGILGLYALSVLLLGLHPLLALPIAVGLPVTITLLWLRMAKARYRTDFTADLPEALDVFARGLRAGRPVSDSLSIVVDNATGPVHREFSRCHDEIRMGTSLPDSLGRLELRIPTPEVSFFSVATSLQSETGGNLIETMEGLAGQLRERRKLKKKARALTSEARASAMILAALPFAVMLTIGLLNGSYLTPLYSDLRGQIMAAVALVSIGLGVLMMMKMGKLDV